MVYLGCKIHISRERRRQVEGRGEKKLPRTRKLLDDDDDELIEQIEFNSPGRLQHVCPERRVSRRDAKKKRRRGDHGSIRRGRLSASKEESTSQQASESARVYSSERKWPPSSAISKTRETPPLSGHLLYCNTACTSWWLYHVTMTNTQSF